MKKLLLVGSSSIHTFNYLNLIRSLFEEVVLITDIDKEIETCPVHKVNFSIRNPLHIASNVKKIRKVINHFKPDIIHVHQANSCSWLTLLANKKTKIPVLVTAWGSDILINPEKNIFHRALVKTILKDADAFTSDSSYMAEKMRRLLPARNLKITVANFGIDASIKPATKEKVAYSNRLHKPLYRIDKIIAAFAKFVSNNENSDWKLIIAATGEETGNLQVQCKKLNIAEKVEFVGWLDKEKNRHYYSIASIYVSIPESDATAISLLEAMAAGCVPVLSDLPANREWVKHKENGIIVSDLETDFISSALSLDITEVEKINTAIIKEHGTHTANREKFHEAYKSLLS